MAAATLKLNWLKSGQPSFDGDDNDDDNDNDDNDDDNDNDDGNNDDEVDDDDSDSIEKSTIFADIKVFFWSCCSSCVEDKIAWIMLHAINLAKIFIEVLYSSFKMEQHFKIKLVGLLSKLKKQDLFN